MYVMTIIKKTFKGMTQSVVLSTQKRTILLAIDNGENAKYAFNYTIKNILKKDEDLLVLLHVRQDPMASSMMVGFPTPLSGDVVDALRKASDETEIKLLRFYKDLCDAAGVKYDIKTVVGDARVEITEEAKRLNSDLVVVGSRALGVMGRAFLGSTSDYLVHHLECPVLVVKNNKQH